MAISQLARCCFSSSAQWSSSHPMLSPLSSSSLTQTDRWTDFYINEVIKSPASATYRSVSLPVGTLPVLPPFFQRAAARLLSGAAADADRGECSSPRRPHAHGGTDYRSGRRCRQLTRDSSHTTTIRYVRTAVDDDDDGDYCIRIIRASTAAESPVKCNCRCHA
jgi:hypothetical protein